MGIFYTNYKRKKNLGKNEEKNRENEKKKKKTGEARIPHLFLKTWCPLRQKIYFSFSLTEIYLKKWVIKPALRH